MKKLLKSLIRKWLPFFNWCTRMTAKKAKTILLSAHKDPSTTCVGQNALSIQYDLVIIIPAYNVGKYIGQCLESAVNQKNKILLFDYCC